MLVLSGDVLTIFWIAAVPAFLAVFLLTFGVREQGSPEKTASASPLRPAEFARLNSAVWTVIAAASCLTLAGSAKPSFSSNRRMRGSAVPGYRDEVPGDSFLLVMDKISSLPSARPDRFLRCQEAMEGRVLPDGGAAEEAG